MSLACLSIQGIDAQKFLQGQVTCDVTKVTPTTPSLGALCNIKGRAYASFLLCNTTKEVSDDNIIPQYVLIIHHDIIQKTLLTLKKYIAFFKCDAEILNIESHILSSLPSTTNTEQLNFNFNSVITHTEEKKINSLTITLFNDLQLKIQFASLAASNHIALVNFTETDKNLWKAHCIKHKLLLINDEISEQYIPSEIHYNELNGISYDKGCYTGQEVIARLYYRASPSQKLYKTTIDALNQLKEQIPCESSLSEQNTNTALVVLKNKVFENIPDDLKAKFS